MRLHLNGGRAKLGLVIILAFVVGLVGSTGASAAPGDNLRNAGKCLRGRGWYSLQTSTGRSFGGPISCVIYALRGGTFGVVTVPDPGPVTPPSE
jgi:hypothetical protein